MQRNKHLDHGDNPKNLKDNIFSYNPTYVIKYGHSRENYIKWKIISG